MSDALLVERQDHLLRLTINRPAERNALDAALLDQLAETLIRHAGDEGILCAVISGAGDQCFATCADHRTLQGQRAAADARSFSRRGRTALDQVRAFPVPVIAALNGHAFGGGAELALACDLRVGASHAELGFLQTQLNVTTAWGGGIDLSLTVGESRALRILATGARLEAGRALDLGLIDWVSAPGQSLEHCLETFLAPWLARTRAVLAGYKAPIAAHRRRIHAELGPLEEEQFVRSWVHADHWAAVSRTSA